jgi:spermidine/putrescine-binding protein
MKFAAGIIALLATGAAAFAPIQATARSSSLNTYTFAKSEEIFTEAKEVGYRLLERGEPNLSDFNEQ